MWTPQECDNDDSCAEGQKHFFPDPGDIVRIYDETFGTAVRTGREIKLPAGDYTVGPHVNPQTHLVSLIFKNHLVWASDDEIHPRGPEDFANIQLARV